MAFKSAADILNPDCRFDNLCVVEAGIVRSMTLADHHQMICEVALRGDAPTEVREAFDRARNILLYSYFDYDLTVVAEVQAFGAFELSLKHRLNGHGGQAKGTLRNLVDRARKQKIFEALPAPPEDGSWRPPTDRVEIMIMLRNDLAHGTANIHTPGMSTQILELCAWGIDTVFPVTSVISPGAA
jgi:hypothetical protein